MKFTIIAAALLLAFGAQAQEKKAAKAAAKGPMSFFVTSTGKGNGADLGGLEGADAHCSTLAKAAGSKEANWKAYLSTSLPGGDAGVNARERIGKGPWYNAKGVMVARNVSELHSAKQHQQADGARRGQPDQGPRRHAGWHDILTAPTRWACTRPPAATPAATGPRAATAPAIVSHHDLQGLKDTRHMKSLRFLLQLARLQPGPAHGFGRRGTVLLFRREVKL